MTSILLTYSSKSKWIVLIGLHIIPYVFCLLWSFNYIHEFQSGYLYARHKESILPIVHNVLMIWLYFGFYRTLETPTPFIILALCIFPINALFMLTLTSTLEAWAGSAITSASMIGLVMMIESDK